MKLTDLDLWLRKYLDLDAFDSIDQSRNGLQVTNKAQDVTKVAFAVDASLESFRRAVELGAQMLFVHHGILWDRQERFVGAFYERVRALIEGNLALYAAHLPLDQHPEVGNNIGMAAALGLRDIEPFGTYRGVKIGYKGTLSAPARLEQVISRLFGDHAGQTRTLPFGPESITRVGIISGSAARDVTQAVDQGLDLFITGEPLHAVYHHCLESHVHVIFAGHYQSETFGVRLLSQKLARQTGLETVFIDVPTGL
ncbi:MAG TPA: Nif3-like dinuclear metal center hexameric protein [Spirochaetia bacterium]|nr:Nif3-like dinuclear metal center hexameric protein [Spirochaetia bacterium]